MFWITYYVSSALLVPWCFILFHAVLHFTLWLIVLESDLSFSSLKHICDENKILFFTICSHFLLFLAFWPLSLLLLFSYSLLPHLLPVSIPLQFSSSLKSFFLYFCPLCYFLSFYSHPSSTHFLSLSNPICQMFDQLRQHEEINSHPFIIHAFSSSLSICPFTTSDPAT